MSRQTSSIVQSEQPDGLPTPQRYWAAAAVALGIMMSVLDGSVVNVALPAIAKELGITESASVWIVNSYNLSVLAFLLPCAALGERIGLQKVFRIGLVIFVLGSLGFMFSESLMQICSFKVVQGVGGAAMMSMMGGLTRFNYPAHLFGRGIGVNAMIVSISSMSGPMVGSAILYYANWHWLAFLNIPIGLFALVLSLNLSQTPQKKKTFDYQGAMLSAITLCLFVYSLDNLATHTSYAIFGMMVALACGWFAIQRAKAKTAPLIPVDLLQIQTFRFAIYVSSCSFVATMAMLVCLPFHLQTFFGLKQLQVGYYLMVWPLGAGLMATIAGRLSDKYSAALLAGIGAFIMALSILCLALAPSHISKPWLFIFIALMGIGVGFFQTPNNKAMLSAAPKERSGAAGGVQATARVFSQSIGAAIVAVALALPIDMSTRVALWVGFIFAFAALIINVVRYKTLE